jgi:hypothetical protein
MLRDILVIKKKKNKERNRGWGMAQVVRNLPCKHKALSSNISTEKKIKTGGVAQVVEHLALQTPVSKKYINKNKK